MSDSLPVVRFDTRAVSSREQFGAYAAAMARTPYEIVPHGGSSPERFHAGAALWNLGPVMMTSFFSQPQSMRRTRRGYRSDGFDHYVVMMVKQGRGQSEVDGRTQEGPPMTPFVFDLAQPFDTVALSSSKTVVLGVPRDLLEALVPARIAPHGAALRGAAAELFAEHLYATERRLDRLTASDAPHLARAACNLLAACLAPGTEAMERARPDVDAALLSRAARHVDANLHDPSLTPATMARAIGVSRSALYRLFEPHGGVAAFVLRRRLRRAHWSLSDPGDRSLVADVAFRCGFADASHFSRAFRRAYGYPPSDVRAAPRPPSPAPAGAAIDAFGAGVVSMLRGWAWRS